MAKNFSFFNSSISFVIIVVIMVFTVANFYSMKTNLYSLKEIQIQKQDSEYHMDTIYEQLPMRELRRAALISAETNRKAVLASAVGKENRKFYTNIKIEAFCPEKYRVGEKDDGGKVVCNPKRVRQDCTLMSLGLNNQVEYDQKIMNVTENKCVILGADKDPQNMNTVRAYYALKGRVYTGKIPDQLTIEKILLDSYRKDVEILKIDIEGGEFTGLEPFLKSYFVCQILIEIHGWPPEHLEMLQKIARYGFRIFNIEENHMCTRCCEYSFINEMCMAQFGVIPLAVNIPVS